MVNGLPLAWFLLPAAVVWLLPLCSDGISLAVRYFRRARAPRVASASSARLCFLVPAHNEEHSITRCVESLRRMRHTLSSHEIWVIADNCSDQTSGLAQAAGARVLERSDPLDTGKPAAIRWALSSLPMGDFDAAVIIDADTVVDEHFGEALCGHSPLRDKACQAYFRTMNPGESWLTRLGDLFATVRYEGQFELKRAAGLNAVLTGNGMCLGSALMARHGWNTTSLTEDIEMYAKLTAAGERIEFVPGAVLYSWEAGSLALTAAQRRRWSAGRWQSLSRCIGPLLKSPRIGYRQKLDAAVELFFPGPVLHGAVGIVVGTISLVWGRNPVIAWAFLLSPLPTVLWTSWGLNRRPDRRRLVLDLLRLPAYAVWRVFSGIVAVAQAGSTRWERSPRPRTGPGRD